MITKEEAQALLMLMGRVNISGNEAETVVVLKQKLAKIAQPNEKEQPTKKDRETGGKA